MVTVGWVLRNLPSKNCLFVTPDDALPEDQDALGVSGVQLGLL